MNEEEKGSSEPKVDADQNGDSLSPQKGHTLGSPATSPKDAGKKKRSEKQILASQGNGCLSKGPTTRRGKQCSRVNSFKLGLTGTGKAIPLELQAEFDRLHREVAADLVPVGSMEEWLVKQIAWHRWLLERANAAENAQLRIAQRAAILAPYQTSYDGAFEREEEIERLGGEVARLETLIAGWQEESGLTQQSLNQLKELSIAKDLLGIEHAESEEQLELLLQVAAQQREILSALEGEEVPALTRAFAAHPCTDLHRHQVRLQRRLESHLRLLTIKQNRRLALQLPSKRPPKMAPVIDVDGSEERA
jgi:hypothetical protein